MKLGILVSGRNRKLVGDLCEHLEKDRGYLTLKCAPTENALFDIIIAEMPKVIMLCLRDETVNTVLSYNVLKNVCKNGDCTIIVIANEDDEKLFMKYTSLERALFLSRPVSLLALYEKLSSIEEEVEKNKDKNPNAFREFYNEEATVNGNRRKHIMVVDDDSEQLMLIKDQLSEFYDVTLVKSGDAAFKFLIKKIPDLILLDYLMPEKDGPQVLRQMQTIDDYAKIPVVFLTGMTEKNAVKRTIMELKPKGYIIKPAKKSALVAKIIDILG